MRLSLPDIRRLALEVAREEGPGIDVVATTNPEGAVDYTEVVLSVGDSSEPRRIVVSVRRTASAETIRRTLQAQLRHHLHG